MAHSVKRKLIIISAVLLTAIIIITLIINRAANRHDMYLGGTVHKAVHTKQYFSAEANQTIETDVEPEDYNERYQRPSKALPLANEYTFQSFMKSPDYNFSDPIELICAFYGVLKEASNMAGYEGGCGTIGDADLPYEYSYKMFTDEVRSQMTLAQFTDSFAGVGHISLLKLVPLPVGKDIPSNERHYMVEIELITGPQSVAHDDYKNIISYFAYCFGIVTVVCENSKWQMQSIDYLPEEFLCAPYHSWFYDSSSIVEIVYKDNLRIIDSITDTTRDNELIQIYAAGNGIKYRFDFIRLTNGHDILIGEYTLKNEDWLQTSLLPEEWQYLKLSFS